MTDMEKAMEALEQVACKGKPVICAGCGRSPGLIANMGSFDPSQNQTPETFDYMICVQGYGWRTNIHRKWDCKFCPQCSAKMKERLDQGQSVVEQNILSQAEIVERAAAVIDRMVGERTDRIGSKVLTVFHDFLKSRKLKLKPKVAQELWTKILECKPKNLWDKFKP